MAMAQTVLLTDADVLIDYRESEIIIYSTPLRTLLYYLAKSRRQYDLNERPQPQGRLVRMTKPDNDL